MLDLTDMEMSEASRVKLIRSLEKEAEKRRVLFMWLSMISIPIIVTAGSLPLIMLFSSAHVTLFHIAFFFSLSGLLIKRLSWLGKISDDLEEKVHDLRLSRMNEHNGQ